MTFKINRNEAKIEMLTTNTTFGQYFELVTTLQRNAMLRVFCLQSGIERERENNVGIVFIFGHCEQSF